MKLAHRPLLLALPASLLLTAAAVPPAPDILPMGHRAVVHELVVEASPALAGWRLVATPTRGFHGVHAVEPGAPFTFSSKYGTKLYAIRDGDPLPPHPVPAEWKKAHPSSPIPVAQVATVAIGDSTARVVTTLRIETVDAETLKVAEIETKRFDADGEVPGRGVSIAVLIGAAAAGLTALVRLLRRR